MLYGKVAKRYAKALIAIGKETRQLEPIGKDLDAFLKLFEKSPELKYILLNPSFPLDKKKAVLTELLKRTAPLAVVRSFLMLLLDKHRLGAIEAIRDDYHRRLDQIQGRVRAEVISARHLPPQAAERIRQILEKMTGKKVVMTTSVDSSLIGGVVTRVGSMVLDGSVRTQIRKAREQLLAARG